MVRRGGNNLSKSRPGLCRYTRKYHLILGRFSRAFRLPAADSGQSFHEHLIQRLFINRGPGSLTTQHKLELSLTRACLGSLSHVLAVIPLVKKVYP